MTSTPRILTLNQQDNIALALTDIDAGAVIEDIGLLALQPVEQDTRLQ